MDYFVIWRYFGWVFGILSLGSLALKQWGIWRRFVQISSLFSTVCGCFTGMFSVVF